MNYIQSNIRMYFLFYSMQSSHPYEALPDIPTKKESNDAKYKRSRSVGPVVEAAQKELLASAIARERSRSRGPTAEKQQQQPPPPPNDSGGRRGYKKEANSLESSRGRSRTKLERSASNKMKVDVMDPFLSSNGPPGPHGPLGPPSRGMPARQKSMIDLRDPSWDPPKHVLHQNGRQGTPPRHFGFGAPQNMQPHPPQQQPHRPPMMRSATEHDIKVRNRRSMAVGPFEDLPPHIRQHMVSKI